MNNKKKYSQYVISFCVPCLVFTLLLAVFKIAPFGDYTLFFNDMSGQYISFFSYLKQMLMGEKSSLYTFSKLIGGDLQGWISYYLLSPFNFIVLLFKTSDMALAASALTLAKLGSCGLTSYIFLSKKSDSMPLKLIFSTAYALMAYNIVYAQNIMWLDGVIILPIIAIGIDDIIDKNKYLTYIMALAYGIITNYYIGYMLCGFSVIYFLFKLLLKDGAVLKEKAKKLGIFTYGSLTGGAISAFVLLPTIKSLEGTTKQSLPLNELISLSTNLRMRELVKHIFFPSATLNDFSTNLPNVYVGLVVLIMMLLFFVSRKIHWKEKLLAFGIVIFFIASFYFTTPNLAWHGFMYPVCFSFRFSFIFSFFVILFAFRFMQTMDIDNKKLLLYGALAVNTAFIFAFAFSNFRTAYLTENSFKTFYNDVKPSVDAVKSLEKDEFYRIEKDFAYSLNDAMTFGYNGLEHYSSGEKLITRKLPKIMGYPVREAYGKYGNGSTLSADSFWGIKYLMTHGEGKQGTEKINEINGVSTYKNPYALPLAIISDREILDLRTSTLHMSDAAGEILSCALKEAYSFVNTQENTAQELVNVDKSTEDNQEVYSVISAAESANINYSFTAQQTGNLYLHIDTAELPVVYISVNGKGNVEYLSPDNFGIATLGRVEKGEEVQVKLRLNAGFKTNSINFLYDNNEALGKMSEEIKAQNVSVTNFKQSRFEVFGEIKEDNSGVLLMLPNQEGWVIEQGGKDVEYDTAIDTFIYIPLEKGRFSLTARFVPKGVYMGFAVTAIGLVQLAAVYMYQKRRCSNR